MLAISESSFAALTRRSEQDYAQTLAAWVRQRPELAGQQAQATQPWCEETLQVARRFGIGSEDDVARFARLRLLRGDAWLQSAPAQEILGSQRDGQLKAFQLECLHWNIAHGQ